MCQIMNTAQNMARAEERRTFLRQSQLHETAARHKGLESFCEIQFFN